jgi:zinc transporter 10
MFIHVFTGDFAVLLHAGMSVKQALIYNGVSSILCFVGMLIGVAIGNMSGASLWIFSLTAGMFLYIALVDMVSRLTTHMSKMTCSFYMEFYTSI